MRAVELPQQRAAHTDMVIVDVRSALEYRRGHVPGAVHLPFWAAAFQAVAARRPASAPIVVYCGHGPSAWIARTLLRWRGSRKRVPARRPHGRVAARGARRAVGALIVMAASPLPRLRRLCLALPEAHEVIAWGEPTFRVRNKMFATFASAANHHGRGRHAAWVKALPVNQDLLVRSAPSACSCLPTSGRAAGSVSTLTTWPTGTRFSAFCGRGMLVAPKRLAGQVAQASPAVRKGRSGVDQVGLEKRRPRRPAAKGTSR